MMKSIFFLFILLLIAKQQYAQNYDLSFAINEYATVKGIPDSTLIKEAFTEVVANLMTSYQQQEEFNFYHNYKNKVKKQAGVIIKLDYGTRHAYRKELIENELHQNFKEKKYFIKYTFYNATTDSVIRVIRGFHDKPLPLSKPKMMEVLAKITPLESVVHVLYPPVRQMNIQNVDTYYRNILVDDIFKVYDKENEKYSKMLVRIIKNGVINSQKKWQVNYYDENLEDPPNYTVSGELLHDKDVNKYMIILYLNKRKTVMQERTYEIEPSELEQNNLTALVFKLHSFISVLNYHFVFEYPNKPE